MLPGRAYEFGLAIQDRAFTADGQLYCRRIRATRCRAAARRPTFTDADRPADTDHPARVLRRLHAGQRHGLAEDGCPSTTYRFHLLNGSDSRFEILRLDNPHVKVTLVGGEGGLLERAVAVMDGDGKQENGEEIVLGPGERVDAVFDFSGLHPGDHVTLQNFGPAFDPFQGLDPDGSLANDLQSARDTRELQQSVGQIMQFQVGSASAGLPHASVHDGTVLNPGDESLAAKTPDHVRKLGLFEGADEFGRVEAELGVAEDTKDASGNTVPFGPRSWDDPITEAVKLEFDGAVGDLQLHRRRASDPPAPGAVPDPGAARDQLHRRGRRRHPG